MPERDSPPIELPLNGKTAFTRLNQEWCLASLGEIQVNPETLAFRRDRTGTYKYLSWVNPYVVDYGDLYVVEGVILIQGGRIKDPEIEDIIKYTARDVSIDILTQETKKPVARTIREFEILATRKRLGIANLY